MRHKDAPLIRQEKAERLACGFVSSDWRLLAIFVKMIMELNNITQKIHP